MASYICKCGRVVEKSTTANNTGNRDTAGCEGCPYLLPWGPFTFGTQEDGTQGYRMDIKGYECRMSPTLEYRTELHGRLDDKTTIRITSLDFDFLERVSNWVKEHYPNGELLGGFSRDCIRAVEYVDEGRYRYMLACSQNKKGIAAKRALWAEFFDETFRRKDMDADEEKRKILRDIEQGKAAAQRKEDKMQTDDHGIMTDAGELLENGTECRRHAVSRARTEMGKVQAIHVCDDQPEGVKIWMNASCPGEYWVLLEAGKIEGEHVESCPYCAALLGIGCGDVLLVPFGAELKSNKLPKIPEENNEPACSCAGCKREDCICAGEHDAAGRADCTGEQNCAQSGCAYTAKHPINPTQAAPASPAGAGAATQNLSAADAASLEADPAPKFDFSALGDLAEQAAEADEQFNLHYGRAQDEYLIACIYMARVHELTAKSGRRGGGTWTAWYQSKGISEGSARTMVQNGDGLKSATVADFKNLPALTKKDLNLIVRRGAVEQVLEAAKENDSERVQEILAQLKSEREARKKAEHDAQRYREDSEKAREAAHTYHCQYEQASQQRNALLDQQTEYISRIEAAEKDKVAAQRRAVEAEKERDGARQALRGTRKQEEKWREKAQTVQAQLDQLQSQPIPSTAIDMDEVERRVAERMEAERAKQPPEDPERAQQDSRDAYDAFILATRTIDNIWKTLRPQVGRLGALQGNAKNMLLQQLMKVKEELIHECEDRQS